jgi:hypothetical protein
MHKIAKSEAAKRWVNPESLKRLSGFGEDVADVFDFAINRLCDEGKLIIPDVDQEDFIQRNISIDVHLFPKHLAADPFFLFMAERDYIEKWDTEKEYFLRNNEKIFFLDNQNRPVLIFIYPPAGHENSNGNLGIWEFNTQGQDQPMRRYFTSANQWLINITHQKKPYVIYLHSIVPNDEVLTASSASPLLSYIGMTKQGWQRRFAQHMSSARKGSKTYFHRALRDHYPRAVTVQHRILAVLDTEDAAQDVEELFVDGVQEGHEWYEGYMLDFQDKRLEHWVFGTLYPKGLNMIRGGKAGLKDLHKMGAFEKNTPITADAKEDTLMRRLAADQRLGTPNPLLAAHWQNDDYALKIICGPEGRLNPDQIDEARTLSLLGRDTDEIAKMIGAKNERQVKNLLDGKTYSRVKKKS